jgi:hypothetical protein
MAGRRPLIPLRHLLIMFVAITVGLAGALVWLGTRLLRQDRDLEDQYVRDRLERLSSMAASALQLRLQDAEARLDSLAALPTLEREPALQRLAEGLGAGAVVLDASGERVVAVPAPAPVRPHNPVRAPPRRGVRAARTRVPLAAVPRRGRNYRSHAADADPRVRGAPFSGGRVLRQQGRQDGPGGTRSAVGAWLGKLDGYPAELLGRSAISPVLEGHAAESRGAVARRAWRKVAPRPRHLGILP